MIKLIITTSEGAYDVTRLATTVTWSGDYQSCCRRLEFGIAVSDVDTRIPAVDVPLGALVQLYSDGQEIFRGIVFRRRRGTGDTTMAVTALDRGIYLKSNETYTKSRGETPEALTKRLCAEFDIPIGSIAITGVAISRTFFGVSLYDIIMTAYTLASQKNGKKYIAWFNGDRLVVSERAVDGNTLIIEGSSILISASVDENAENMVNRVRIVNDDYSLVKTIDEKENIDIFGVLQSIIKNTDEAEDQARDLLEENGVRQTITVESLGDVRSITGRMVAVREPITGVCGLFHIDADTHTWKTGQYLNKLTLNFKAIMDDTEAGTLEQAAEKQVEKKKTSSKAPKDTDESGGGGISWIYVK